jgi:hypothetical protein
MFHSSTRSELVVVALEASDEVEDVVEDEPNVTTSVGRNDPDASGV